MTDLYVPGTEETDPKKVIMSLQNMAGATSAAIDDVAANTANIAANTTNIAANTTNIASNTAALATIAGSPIRNSLSADVPLNNTANFFDGPSIAQGIVGTWVAFGQVTVIDTSASANYIAKLWDGTTVIDSAVITTPSLSLYTVFTLSGIITSPVGNIRISVKDQSTTSGKIIFNASGLSRDSTISAFRIA